MQIFWIVIVIFVMIDRAPITCIKMYCIGGKFAMCFEHSEGLYILCVCYEVWVRVSVWCGQKGGRFFQ